MDFSGSFSFSYSDDNDDAEGYDISFTLSPSIGIFFVKGFRLGIGFPILAGFSKGEESSETQFGVGLGIQPEYVVSITQLLNFYGGLHFGIMYSYISESNDSDLNLAIDQFFLGPQLGIRLTPGNALIDIGLIYTFTSSGGSVEVMGEEHEIEDRVESHYVGINLGFGFWKKFFAKNE